MRLCAALAAMAPPALLPTLCDAQETMPPSGFAWEGMLCSLRNQVFNTCHCSFVRSQTPIVLYGLVWRVVELAC